MAAVEFVFLAPIMMLLFVGTIELSAGISVDRKLSRASDTISDLIAHSDALTAAEVDAMMDAAAKVLYPFSDRVTIVVTGVAVDKDGVATVSWSRSEPAGHANTVGAAYRVPADIGYDKSFLVSAKVATSYAPTFGWGGQSTSRFSASAIDLEKERILQPRNGLYVALN